MKHEGAMYGNAVSMGNTNVALDASSPAEPPPDLVAVEGAHTLWLASAGKEGLRANLEGIDLSGADLADRQFAEANMRGAILIGARLAGTDLRSADLSGAILDEADLQGAFLSGAMLAHAQMRKANATGADLTAADCTGVMAEGIELQGAKMDNAVLCDAVMPHANCTHISLRGANLRGASLVTAVLREADLSDADCRNANFDHADFAGAILRQTAFRASSMSGVDLHATDFSVALDLSQGFQDELAQSQHVRIQAEQDKIESERAELQAHEQLLEEERNRMVENNAAMAGQQEEWMRRLRSSSRKLAVCSVLWVVVALGVLGLTAAAALEVDNLRMDVLGAIIGTLLFVLVLAITSAVCSFKACRVIKQSAQAYAGAGEVADMGSAAQPHEPRLESPAPPPKPKRGLFGKKN